MSASPAPSLTPAAVHELKRERLAEAGGRTLPSNVEWIASLPPEERARLGIRYARKPTRTLSGVAIVAVMTSPARCPHGRCTYCPGGVDSATPQSYTGEEPSALRGAQYRFDSEAIVRSRLAALEAIGHPTSKVEAIVMGGTFPARPRAYQREVFEGIYRALNGGPSPSLAVAERSNETADHRLVSLTVETRPDWCDGRTLPFLLDAGVTRVELGVECLRDDVLENVGRAHGIDEVTRASREARDRGLKLAYHLMPGLPGMDPVKDLADFERLFDDPAFRPDMIKVYPTLVLPGTGLFDDWRAGRFTPYSTETATELVARMKARLPPWVRLQRVQRDIPARLIAAGVRAGNLRELARKRLESDGGRCRCLRCREPGRRATPAIDSFELTERSYPAQGGVETFLSLEDPVTDCVAAFLRLRSPSGATEGGLSDPVIRELKVLGPEVPVGAPAGAWEYQHRGFGRRLLQRAEEVAVGQGRHRIYVLSAVGTREYYRRHGYTEAGPWMAKGIGT